MIYFKWIYIINHCDSWKSLLPGIASHRCVQDITDDTKNFDVHSIALLGDVFHETKAVCTHSGVCTLKMPEEAHLYIFLKCFLVTLNTTVKNRQMEKALIQLLLSLSREIVSLNYNLNQSAQRQTISLSCCVWLQDFTVQICSFFSQRIQPNCQNIHVLSQAQVLGAASLQNFFYLE